MFDVIYLAGGTGKRANLGYPKQFGIINGKLIFMYGIETLIKLNKENKIINKIILVSSNKEDEKNYISNMLRTYDIHNEIDILVIEGGETRQESVYKGIQNVNTENLLIMESVRPFTSKELIKKVIETNKKIVIPRNDTLSTLVGQSKIKKDDGNRYYTDVCSIDKKLCGEVQMPQKFPTKTLFDLHNVAIETNMKNLSDDLALILKTHFSYKDNTYHHIENDIAVIIGEEENIKITTPLDLKLSEVIYKYKFGEYDE